MENMRRIEAPPAEGAAPLETRMPRMGEQVVVQCEGYRCLAYLDKDGKWRSAHSGKELPRVLRVLQHF